MLMKASLHCLTFLEENALGRDRLKKKKFFLAGSFEALMEFT